ncbi:hypothetical protein CYMTET_53328 [Cymbomonas tetramitiformis]|uniref:Uncharacterized protein n=1 Tax=Cymbomonas tetramitiformis TaxID=36881 RepID=A0AAE0BH97_9CHLO|nr:hypothetical protein CYMTET_53328 [Cymbomonas tetramitiformis]
MDSLNESPLYPPSGGSGGLDLSRLQNLLNHPALADPPAVTGMAGVASAAGIPATPAVPSGAITASPAAGGTNTSLQVAATLNSSFNQSSTKLKTEMDALRQSLTRLDNFSAQSPVPIQKAATIPSPSPMPTLAPPPSPSPAALSLMPSQTVVPVQPTPANLPAYETPSFLDQISVGQTDGAEVATDFNSFFNNLATKYGLFTPETPQQPAPQLHQAFAPAAASPNPFAAPPPAAATGAQQPPLPQEGGQSTGGGGASRSRIEPELDRISEERSADISPISQEPGEEEARSRRNGGPRTQAPTPSRRREPSAQARPSRQARQAGSGHRVSGASDTEGEEDERHLERRPVHRSSSRGREGHEDRTGRRQEQHSNRSDAQDSLPRQEGRHGGDRHARAAEAYDSDEARPRNRGRSAAREAAEMQRSQDRGRQSRRSAPAGDRRAGEGPGALRLEAAAAQEPHSDMEDRRGENTLNSAGDDAAEDSDVEHRVGQRGKEGARRPPVCRPERPVSNYQALREHAASPLRTEEQEAYPEFDFDQSSDWEEGHLGGPPSRSPELEDVDAAAKSVTQGWREYSNDLYDTEPTPFGTENRHPNHEHLGDARGSGEGERTKRRDGRAPERTDRPDDREWRGNSSGRVEGRAPERTDRPDDREWRGNSSGRVEGRAPERTDRPDDREWRGNSSGRVEGRAPERTDRPDDREWRGNSPEHGVRGAAPEREASPEPEWPDSPNREWTSRAPPSRPAKPPAGIPSLREVNARYPRRILPPAHTPSGNTHGAAALAMPLPLVTSASRMQR